MISCTEFIPFYNELFKFIDKMGGDNAVKAYWELISEEFIEPRLGALTAEKGMMGCFEYWSKSLNEEAADFLMTYDDQNEELEIHMRYCPSKGKLKSLPHIEPYLDYCGHCKVIYSNVLKKFGYIQEFDQTNTDDAMCYIKFKKEK